MLRELAEEQLKLSGTEIAVAEKNDLREISQSDQDLWNQIKKGSLATYWPVLIRKIYFEQDKRLF